MSSKHALLVGVTLIVAACSIGRPVPTATTYSIEPRAAVPGMVKVPHPERLRVDRVRVAAPYDGIPLVYRLSPVRYTADPYHAFLAEPGPMLTNRISEWLTTAGVFGSVEGPGGAVPASLVLEATVTELYGDFEANGVSPGAVLSIRFNLVDERGAHPRVVYERTLSQRASLSNATPEALVLGYGTALADILTQLATDLADASIP
jgi:cholesterol transport system auxiliary component